VRTGLRELRSDDRRVMLMLFGDDDLSFRDISRTLGIPPGRIGPTRAGCLESYGAPRAVSDLAA